MTCPIAIITRWRTMRYCCCFDWVWSTNLIDSSFIAQVSTQFAIISVAVLPIAVATCNSVVNKLHHSHNFLSDHSSGTLIISSLTSVPTYMVQSVSHSHVLDSGSLSLPLGIAMYKYLELIAMTTTP